MRGKTRLTDAKPKSGPAVRLVDVEKTFTRADGSKVKPIDGVSIDIEPGELVVLLGPSGCGKTTLLRAIAGLERPDAGQIDIHGNTVFRAGGVNVPPERRHIGMIFQSYALWPHLTVVRNVAYPLRSAGVPKPEALERADEALATVGISEVRGQLPHRLSGGQQQRVALARALVARPGLILFDEPLSNVDAKVREELRLELIKTQREVGFTGVYVTHDQSEALDLADRIVVLRSGRIEQIGSPREVYQRPRTAYVADFVGRINHMAGRVAEAGDAGLRVTTTSGTLTAQNRFESPGEAVPETAVKVMWRPERTRSHVEPTPGAVEATVIAVRFLGAHDEIVCVTGDGTELSAISAAAPLPQEGDKVWFTVDPADLWAFPLGDLPGERTRHAR